MAVDKTLQQFPAEASPLLTDIIPTADPVSGPASKLTLQQVKDLFDTVDETSNQDISGIKTFTNGIRLEETGAGTDSILLTAPASLTASYNLVLPVDDGNAGELLSTDGVGNTSWIPAPGTIPFIQARTIYVDYTAAGPGVIGDEDNPYPTKALALIAAATLAPTAANRVLISVAMGTSADPISYLSSVLGVDWDLNGGSINVASLAISAIDDGGFAVDSVVYNAHTLQSSGGTGRGVAQTGSSTIIINSIKITSSVGNAVHCTAGILTIRSEEINVTAGSGDCVAVSAGIVTIYAKTITGSSGNSNTDGVTCSGGVLRVYADEITTNGNNGVSSSGSSTVTIFARSISATGINSTNGILCTGGVQTVHSDIISCTQQAAIACSAGTQIIKAITISTISTGVFGVSCTGTGSQNIEGNISCEGALTALTYSSSGISEYNSNLTSVTGLALNVAGSGTVRINSGSRIVTGGTTAITKSAGVLILEGGVSLISTTNSITGAGTVLVYGTIVQKFIQTGVTYSIGAVITDVAVV